MKPKTPMPVVIISIVILGAMAAGGVLIYQKLTSIKPFSLEVSLERYYLQHKTYPYSLADLPDVKKADVAKGSSLIYRTIDRDRNSYTSYNAQPVTQTPGIIMCGYTIDHQKTDSFGLNPKITSTSTVTHC